MSVRLAPLVLPLLVGLSWFPGMGLAGGLPHPTSTSRTPSAVPARSWLKSELYFGARFANGGLISREAWDAFLDTVITPAFPDGLTVLDAYGQMKGPDGVMRHQPTWVVVILRPAGPTQDQRLQSVISSFRSRFTGAEVMRVDSPVAAPQFFAN